METIFAWQDEGVVWQIIHGDSRLAIPDEEFHLVVTSPPYNVGKAYADHDDAIPLEEWLQLITEVLGAAWDRLVDGGRMAVNVHHGVGRNPMIPLGHHVEAIGHGLPDALYRGAIVWHKGPINTTAWGSWLSPSNPVLRGTYEHVHVWSKGTMSRTGGRGDLTEVGFTEATLDTWHIAAEQSRADHPAPFPVPLAERLIRLYTWPGDHVLDPFAGTGSSGVAARRLGRSWVGIDTSADYCRVAKERLEAVVKDASRFDEVGLSDELSEFGDGFARVMAEGARAAGALEVRRFQITKTAGEWERYRRTLSNQVKLGAYGVIQRRDGSRVAWTTSSGKQQLATLRRWSRKPIRTIRAADPEEMEFKLLRDVAQVLVNASEDRRTRAVTARGFTPD